MKKVTLLLFMLSFTWLSIAQVGLNTITPDASSALDIESTTGGILIPRLTEFQRDAITLPATGLMIYQTDKNPGFYFYSGTAWTKINGAAGPQGVFGGASFEYQYGGIGPLLSDVDNGLVRFLDSDAQNLAMQLQFSELDINGSSVYSFIEMLSQTQSTTKGVIRLVDKLDSSKNLQFKITDIDFTNATGSSTPGYFIFDVENVASSSSNPFSDFASYTPVVMTYSISGSDGLQGDQGEQGEQGSAGQDGAVGATGEQGPQGEQGIQGPIGLTGLTGPAGQDGNNGIDGVDGAQGQTGATGPTGPQGEQGIQGPIGLTGATGPSGQDGADGIDGVDGAQGPTGPQGDQGEQGIQGPQGPIGLTGPSGEDGAQGQTGATGPQGIQGEQGEQGIQGPIGLTGVTGPAGQDGAVGATGAQGPEGPQGDQGTQGIQGPIGLTGLTGPAGQDGTQGQTGATGPQGPQGIVGPDGQSAYQIWLSRGNTGTEEDFIASLTGPTGPQGAQGEQGIQGPIGLTGLTGPAGLDGVNGAQGPIGPAGAQGSAGQDGVDGETGPAGETGTSGAQGPIGPQGDIGPVGQAGANGVDGAQGPVGPAGNDGTNGTDGVDATTPNLQSVLAENNSAGQQQIKYLQDPTEAQDAVTKAYIDTIVAEAIAGLQSQIDDLESDDGSGTVTDQDGNTYDYLTYGDQVWTVENAEMVTYRDGTAIPQVTDDTEWENLTTGAWSYFNNDPNKPRLYNWYAVMGIHDTDPNTLNKEFAPEGWHVPSDTEWTTLENHLIANGYNYDDTTTENKIAKAMASTTGWNSSTEAGAVGNDQSLNNSSGFNAFPEGAISVLNEGDYALFWSSTDAEYDGGETAHIRLLGYYGSYLGRLGYGFVKWYGHSVRFVRD